MSTSSVPRVTVVGGVQSTPTGPPGVGVASVSGADGVNTFTLTNGDTYNVPAMPTPAPTHYVERLFRPGRVETRESYVGVTNIYDRPRTIDRFHTRLGIPSAAGTITVTVLLDEAIVATYAVPPGAHEASVDVDVVWPVGGVLRSRVTTTGNTSDASDITGSVRYHL